MMTQIKNYLFQSISESQNDKILTLIGHLFFLTFIVFSLLFYKERLINFDSAFFTFKILTEETFYAAHQRYISVFPQVLPLLAIKFGASLKTVMILYSLSFMLLNYACFLIIRYIFKNPKAGVFFALCLCLCFRYKYFTAISEITASVALFALIIAWLSKDWKAFAPEISIPKIGKKTTLQDKFAEFGILNLRYWIVGFLLLLLTVLAGHKLILVPIMIYLGYEFFLNFQWKNRGFWLMSGAFFIALFLSFALVAERSYEGKNLNRLGDASTILFNLNDQYVWELLVWYFETEYAFPAIIFLIGIGWLLYQKNWRVVLYFLLANVGIGALVLVHNSYINGKILFMADGYFGYFGIVWALFFYLYFIKIYQNRFIIISVLILLIFGTHRIYKKQEFYSERLTYYQKIIEENATLTQRKFVFHKNLFSWDKLWSADFIRHESLLFSALENPDSAVHITIGYTEESIENMKKNTQSLHGTAKIGELPERYFRFGKEGYIEILKVPW